MSAGRNYWGITSKSSLVRRTNSKIVLPAFSAECGQDNNSMQFKGSSTAFTYGVSALAFNPFTVEFWIKPSGANNQKFISKEHPNYSFYITLKTDFILQISVYGATGVPVDLNTGISLTSNTWQHVAVTRSFSAGTTTIQLYLNGNLVYTGSTAAIPADYATPASWTFGGSIADGTLFNGYLAEVRIWSIVRTTDQILYGYNKRLGSPTNANLPIRFPFSEGVGLLANNHGSEGDAAVLNGVTVLFNTSEYPPLRYGASFIAARFPVANLSSSLDYSLKFPIKPPSEVNFMLVVSWTDDDGVFQRCKLWDCEGVDIAPAPVAYNGERLPPTFDFECWNIDGAATIDLATALEIKVSLTNTPTTSVDTAEVDLGTLAKDSTLAQNFLLMPFPLTFSSIQTY